MADKGLPHCTDITPTTSTTITTTQKTEALVPADTKLLSSALQNSGTTPLNFQPCLRWTVILQVYDDRGVVRKQKKMK